MQFGFVYSCYYEQRPGSIVFSDPLFVDIEDDICNRGGATLNSAIQTDPPIANFDGVDTTFTYNPFTITPSECSITIMCASVTPSIPSLPCQEIDLITGTVVWNFTEEDYNNGNVPPGDYDFCYDVSGGPNGPVKQFCITLSVPNLCETADLVV